MNWQLIFSVINFVLFIGILYFLLKDKIKVFFSNRSNKIKNEIQNAYNNKIQLESELANYNKKIALLDKEFNRLKKDTLEKLKIQRSKTLEETEKIAEKINQDSQKIALNNINETKNKLAKEIFESAIENAKKTIEEKLKNNNYESYSNKICKSIF
jgi:F0F1-type ATP synthase membrane subunit b/b'